MWSHSSTQWQQRWLTELQAAIAVAALSVYGCSKIQDRNEDEGSTGD